MKFKFRFFLALSLLFSYWNLSSPADLASADQAPGRVTAPAELAAGAPAAPPSSPTLASLAAAERMAQPSTRRVDAPAANLAPPRLYLPVVFTAPPSSSNPGSAIARPPSNRAVSLAEEVRFVSVDPRLAEFIGSVRDPGQKGQAVGLYVPGALALKIVQQPSKNPVYVSTGPQEVTQFRLAQKTGVLGLLAHNYLAGQYFFDLQAGESLYVIRGDGSYQVYEIYAIEDYQALTITTFRSLPDRKFLDQYALYDRVYRSEGDRLVLQTCIKKGGNLSWGRRFVLAKPVSVLN